jgi:hypothetical protein
MNASDPGPAPATGSTTLPGKAAAAIGALWRNDGPPPAGPLRIWEPERVLAVCGEVHRAGPRPLRGRAATTSPTSSRCPWKRSPKPDES